MWNFTRARKVELNGYVDGNGPGGPEYEEGPYFTHDCECCKYLGYMVEYDRYGEGGKTIDVWLHERDDMDQPSIILRSGSEGPEYESFPLDVAQAVARNLPMPDKWLCAITLERAVNA